MAFYVLMCRKEPTHSLPPRVWVGGTHDERRAHSGVQGQSPWSEGQGRCRPEAESSLHLHNPMSCPKMFLFAERKIPWTFGEHYSWICN